MLGAIIGDIVGSVCEWNNIRKNTISKFIAEMEYNRYLIECRADIVEHISDVQRRFEEWLYDRNNCHGLWIPITDNVNDVRGPQEPRYNSALDPNNGYGVCYGINDFLNWLNRNYGCGAKIVAEENAGLHHIDEYNEWLRQRGLEQRQVHFVRTIDEYNRHSGSNFKDWAEVVENMLQKAPTEEYNDPLMYFAEFDKVSGLTPDILKLHRENNVPLIYF